MSLFVLKTTGTFLYIFKIYPDTFKKTGTILEIPESHGQPIIGLFRINHYRYTFEITIHKSENILNG